MRCLHTVELVTLNNLFSCVFRLGDLPVDSVLAGDMFSIKRARDIPDANDASRADDLSRKVCRFSEHCCTTFLIYGPHKMVLEVTSGQISDKLL